ncbi:MULTISPECIES: hypothetical protein [unclassified Microcoleus]|uniref:hypothetical protein n=1 Tax=unclassified Microcoleus TaxID=2642155 RepID=UPI002FCFCCC8
MTQKSPKINYTKWAFVLGTPIAFMGLIATVFTVPGFRDIIYPKSATSPEKTQEVELITQTELGEPLDGVRIQFIAVGAPPVKYTDSNGYAKVTISSKGDVSVNLTKAGYPPQNFTINLNNEQKITQTIRFSPSGKPIIDELSPALPTVKPTPSPPFSGSGPSTPTATEVKCEDVSKNGNPDYDTDNLISVAKRTEQPSSAFRLSASESKSYACKIINNSGEIKLAYGLPDNSRLSRVSIKIYVDGTLRKDLIFGRGQAIRESLDIKGASEYTIHFEVGPKNAEFSQDSVYNLLPKS